MDFRLIQRRAEAGIHGGASPPPGRGPMSGAWPDSGDEGRTARATGGRWSVFKSTAVLGCACLMLAVERALAVDPLPSQLEMASPAAKREYIERQAQDALRQKIQAGRQRYEQRALYKSQLADGMRLEVEYRKQSILQEIAQRQRQLDQGRRRTHNLIIMIGLLGVVCGGAMLFRREISSLGWAGAWEEWRVESMAQEEASNPALRLAKLNQLARAMRTINDEQSFVPPKREPAKPKDWEPAKPELMAEMMSDDCLHPLLRSSFARPQLAQTPDELFAPVDMDTLRACANDDVDHLCEMAVLYVEQTRLRVEKLKSAIGSGASAEIQRLARMNKTASSLCGMKTMARLFEGLEVKSAQGKFNEPDRECAPLEAELDKVCGYLQSHPNLKGKIKIPESHSTAVA